MTQPQRYTLHRKLGLGTFATVYEGLQADTSRLFAIKIQPKHENSTLVEEAKLLKHLASERREEGIPEVYRCSYQGDRIVMVMQLLGPSVEDLFQLRERKFSVCRALMIAEQALRRIEFVHRKGYLHRDVKPENLLIGKEDQSLIYLVDFGLATRYIQNDGSHIPDRDRLPFVGNPRFASIRAHQGRELSRADDLESLFYMVVYLIKGSLPWQGIKSSTLEEKMEKIKDKKQSNGPELLCKGLPPEVQAAFSHVRGVGFEQPPNYVLVRSLLKNAISQCSEDLNLAQWVKQSLI